MTVRFVFGALSSLLFLTTDSHAFGIPSHPLVSSVSSSTSTALNTATSKADTDTTGSDTMMKVAAKDCYSPAQLKEALNSLLSDSEDPAFDGRHMFGYGDDNHELSMLQTITATVVLDYETYMVCSNW